MYRWTFSPRPYAITKSQNKRNFNSVFFVSCLLQEVFSESFRLRKQTIPLCGHCSEFLSREAVWKHVRFIMICTENVGKSKRKLSIWNFKSECQQESNKIGKEALKMWKSKFGTPAISSPYWTIHGCVVQLSNTFCLIWREVTILDFRARWGDKPFWRKLHALRIKPEDIHLQSAYSTTSPGFPEISMTF